MGRTFWFPKFDQIDLLAELGSPIYSLRYSPQILPRTSRQSLLIDMLWVQRSSAGVIASNQGLDPISSSVDVRDLDPKTQLIVTYSQNSVNQRAQSKIA